MSTIRRHLTFIAVFFAYSKFHRLAYAARIAHGIAYHGLKF